jgi:phage terminase large subunit-like protein
MKQKASKAEGIKREWLRLLSPPWPSFQKVIQSWDCAFGKSSKQGDYSACVTVGVNNNGAHVLHVWKGRPDFPALDQRGG